MFLSGVLLPFAIGMALIIDEPGPLLFPLIIFFAGLAWALYCRLFADDKPAAKNQIPAQVHRAEYLPPAPVNPATVLHAREPNTAEIVQPPSVTEYTTNLLRNRKQT
jgi:hypothetical protein